MEYGIALDLGTSGFRAQAVDLKTGEVVSTAVTARHPLPGANVMDHLHFALEVGRDTAHFIVVAAINKLLKQLDIELSRVERIAVCGNPCQLSIFQNIEIRDLAWAGKRKLEKEGVRPPKRDAAVVEAWKLGLAVRSSAEVLVPPAIKHEVGADALAMMVKGGFLEEKGIALATDYGTNAEMALKVGDEIYTGSAAAGSAIEGQHIERGMLATSGAISDVNAENGGWRCYVLDNELVAQPGDIVDPRSGSLLNSGPMHGKAVGVTGTGVIAILEEGIRSGLISLPRINTPDRRIYLQDSLYFTENDLIEAGKAIGAIRAGHITLAEEAGISIDEVGTMYMAGASGFYVDAHKAQKVGLVPCSVSKIVQVGNTSLAMARELVANPEMLDKLQTIVNELRATHIMFATSKIFEQIYLLELSYWLQGMPIERYDSWLKKYGFRSSLSKEVTHAEVHKLFEKDIGVIGKKGLRVVWDVGMPLVTEIEGCTGCRKCEKECPERALKIMRKGSAYQISIRTDLCNGMSCLRCQKVCSEKVLDFKQLLNEAVSCHHGSKCSCCDKGG